MAWFINDWLSSTPSLSPSPSVHPFWLMDSFLKMDDCLAHCLVSTIHDDHREETIYHILSQVDHAKHQQKYFQFQRLKKQFFQNLWSMMMMDDGWWCMIMDDDGWWWMMDNPFTLSYAGHATTPIKSGRIEDLVLPPQPSKQRNWAAAP